MIAGCCLHREELCPEVNQRHLHPLSLPGAVPGLVVVETWHPPPAGQHHRLLLNHPDKAVSF